MSNEVSDIFGNKTNSWSTEWILVGGPIKGSYAVSGHLGRLNDYIIDFGVRVEDPCQVIDNKQNINLNPWNTTVKDLRYHEGTESQFWLRSVC